MARPFLAAALVLVLAACATVVPPNSTFLVYFQQGSETLTQDSLAQLDRTASAIKSSHPTTIVVSAGSSGADVKTADLRYATVVYALAKRGVSTARIARASLPQGEVKTSAGIERVEIILGYSK